MTDRFRADWPRAAALAALTAAGVYLCWLFTAPFLPGLTWAVALTVVGLPLHRWLTRHVANANLAAGLATAGVVVAIAVPVALVSGQLVAEAKRATEVVREQTADGRWRETARQLPYVGEAVASLDTAALGNRVRAAAGDLASYTAGVAQGAAGGAVQGLLAVFVLFFAFRDRAFLVNETRKLIPLDSAVADHLLARAEDAVHATVYGTLLTATIQGVTGGLVFWAVGLPGAVLWGAVMAVLGALPFVGAFLVWVPAALYLAGEGQWGGAAAVTAWGLVMAGPVANYLYAWAAGDRMRMHEVPTLLAFLGGLAVFGVSGMVLGPCVLAVTAALLGVWRHRAADGIPVAAHTTNPIVRQELSDGDASRQHADAAAT